MKDLHKKRSGILHLLVILPQEGPVPKHGGTGDRQRAALSGITRRTAQDEESEALLNHFFNEFLSSGQVNGSLEKLETSGSFERDGENNVFMRMSRSIIDTLAKHWTTTRGVEILSMAVVSTQLLEKNSRSIKSSFTFLPYPNVTRSCVPGRDMPCKLSWCTVKNYLQ